MPILNLFKRIDYTCLSAKLHLWACNPSPYYHSDLVSSLKTALALHRMEWQTNGVTDSFSISRWYASTKVPRKFPANTPDECYLEEAAKFMVEIFIDYDFYKVPIEQQKNYPLIDRTCEISPIFKIFYFFHFMDLDFSDNPPKQLRPEPTGLGQFPKLSVPHWIAPPLTLWLDMDHMNWQPPPAPENFRTLIIWGKILDNFLQTEHDFHLFFYLLDALYDIKDNWTEFKFLQLFSLIELFLSKKKTSEIDDKLPQFLTRCSENTDKQYLAKLLRQIRNKIAHGEFTQLEPLLSEYYQQFMLSPDNFEPDYGEYSLRNWTLGNMCIQLHTALRHIILLMLLDRKKLSAIRNA